MIWNEVGLTSNQGYNKKCASPIKTCSIIGKSPTVLWVADLKPSTKKYKKSRSCKGQFTTKNMKKRKSWALALKSSFKNYSKRRGKSPIKFPSIHPTCFQVAKSNPCFPRLAISILRANNQATKSPIITFKQIPNSVLTGQNCPSYALRDKAFCRNSKKRLNCKNSSKILSWETTCKNFSVSKRPE